MSSLRRRSSVVIDTTSNITVPASPAIEANRDDQKQQNRNNNQTTSDLFRIPERNLLENANSSLLLTPNTINTLVPFAPFYSFRRSQPFVPRVSLKSTLFVV
jgi:hypothetical protein